MPRSMRHGSTFSTAGGYTGKVLRVNLTTRRVTHQPLSREDCELYIGGRGRDAKVLFDEVPPGIDPLGPKNILCISTGPITGLLGPTSGRVNAAAISPLTGIYGNSNAGTNWGPELKYAGYDGIIVEGKARELCYIFIEDGKAEIRSAAHLRGKGVFETTRTVHAECGEDAKVAAMGSAAENGVLYGSIIFDYWDAAARCGLGTVMASKNLKAVAVRGTGAIRVADTKNYMKVARDGWEAVLNDPGFGTGEHSALGTAICVNWGNAQGWLPTRNFRESHFEGANAISGETFRDRLSTKEAPLPGGRACMSCPNRCKRFGRVAAGKYAGTHGNIEFEGIAAFGSKCGVSDLDAVFHAYMLANDYGMDCITCGNTIALFMELNEAGLMPSELMESPGACGTAAPGCVEGLDLRFGNADAMVECVHRFAQRRGALGKLGALGEFKAAQQMGTASPEAVARCSAIKGMGSIACDGRVAKAFGFTYAVSSRGSDHLRAHPVYEMIGMPKEMSKELFGSEDASSLSAYGGKVEMVAWHENLAAVTDSMGTCRFMHASYYAQYPIPELLAKYGRMKGPAHSIKYHEWLTAATGIKFDYESLMKAGERIITLERAINARLGIRRKDDTLTPRFLTEAIPAGPAKGQTFDPKQFEEMLDRYYELRGWDKKTGLPLARTLQSLLMADVAEKLAGFKYRNAIC